MAQKVQVILVDDLDGGAADETVTFALDGVSYEIDLSAKNAQELRDAFASWVGNARKVSSRSTSRPARRGRSSGAADATKIREWARENGFQVNDRGRISQEVQKAYDAAH
ncbi:histone-like nucleoid-structuring protein Lsr2 [Cellulosimicrobium marinum]|uniref:histone-like nucleoid-structuring protein Lsr2 n=1 Tax=Cellulosimicrobium marinum TaxID=1638992 RepID=UPI001E4B6C87|nr:Lsr2 family protein [Cellulosimicrobium marinum]MCB7136878.1 Lsr2 family protein [Cellulosimicrobium marinum]